MELNAHIAVTVEFDEIGIAPVGQETDSPLGEVPVRVTFPLKPGSLLTVTTAAIPACPRFRRPGATERLTFPTVTVALAECDAVPREAVPLTDIV